MKEFKPPIGWEISKDSESFDLEGWLRSMPPWTVQVHDGNFTLKCMQDYFLEIKQNNLNAKSPSTGSSKRKRNVSRKG